jgi:hypothetical protein
MVAAAVGTTAASLVMAAPASAEGCEVNLLGAQYCDGPIRPDGTWKRCWATGQQIYPSGPTFGVVPAMGNCYTVNPAVPWPLTPIGQPHYYVQQ